MAKAANKLATKPKFVATPAPWEQGRPAVVMTEEKLSALKPRFPLDRASHGTCILLAGDSIFRGWGMGRYDHPNLLNRIEDIANALVQENRGTADVDKFFYYLFTQDPDRISEFVRDNEITSGDIIVYEDAGPHEDNVRARRERLQKLQDAMMATKPKPALLFTTTFDFNPQPTFYNSYYNAWIGESKTTMNDVLVEFSRENSRDYLDWSRMMDETSQRLRKYGLTPMHHDGVHPNVFGNMVLAMSLVAKCGGEIKTHHSMDDAFAQISVEDYARMNIAFRPSAERVQAVLAELKEIALKEARR